MQLEVGGYPVLAMPVVTQFPPGAKDLGSTVRGNTEGGVERKAGARDAGIVDVVGTVDRLVGVDGYFRPFARIRT